MLDLYIFPIHLAGGKELADLPGLVASSAPRRVLRNRAGDMLAALLTLPSKNILTAEAQQEMLLHLSATYFTTPGSVTSGLRAAAEQINTFILGSNQFDSPSGRPNVGVLNLAVIHGNMLYLLHTGPTHTLVVSSDGVSDFVDLEGAGRSLGVSSTITPRYFTTTVREGDMVLLCPSPPTTWTTTFLGGSSKLTLDQFRRRLLAQSPFNMTAAVAQVQSGRGDVHRLRPRIPQEPIPSDPYSLPVQDTTVPESQELPVFPAEAEQEPVEVSFEIREETPIIPPPSVPVTVDNPLPVSFETDPIWSSENDEPVIDAAPVEPPVVLTEPSMETTGEQGEGREPDRIENLDQEHTHFRSGKIVTLVPGLNRGQKHRLMKRPSG